MAEQLVIDCDCLSSNFHRYLICELWHNDNIGRIWLMAILVQSKSLVCYFLVFLILKYIDWNETVNGTKPIRIEIYVYNPACCK